MSSEAAHIEAAFDPFSYGLALPLHATFFPLGFPLELRTNSEDIIAAAEAGCGGYPQLFTAAPLDVRVLVGGDAGAECPTSFESKAQGALMALVSDRANFAVC